MSSRSQATTIDEFISEFPPDTQAVLEQMRALIHGLVPEATETISYAIPTFDLHGKHLVHFAGYEHHVGMYPVPHDDEQLIADVAPYRKGKGTLQFPLDTELPTELMSRVVLQLKTELEGRRK